MFAYRNILNNQWLVYSSRVTHTGSRDYVNWTDDINKAFVGYLGKRKLDDLNLLQVLQPIEVVETRTVTILVNEQKT